MSASAEALPLPIVEAALTDHGPVLRGYFAARCRDADLAADLLQEVALRLVRAAARLDPGRNLRGYVLKVARSVWHDHLRRELIARAAGAELARQDERAAPAADQAMMERELIATVQDAIRRLPESQREVVELRQRDFKFQEIADRLGRPLGTVLTQMRAALRAISAAVERTS
jgi:RNA polymerase sigma factor (sigma-70 family)